MSSSLPHPAYESHIAPSCLPHGAAFLSVTLAVHALAALKKVELLAKPLPPPLQAGHLEVTLVLCPPLHVYHLSDRSHLAEPLPSMTCATSSSTCRHCSWAICTVLLLTGCFLPRNGKGFLSLITAWPPPTAPSQHPTLTRSSRRHVTSRVRMWLQSCG